MKFDLHCHTKEGSIDSKVALATYVSTLKQKGYSGMMITDHDSYKGCQTWDKIKDNPECQDFTVIKGIEYDTRDAGHFLVIMPDGIELDVLQIRGMKLRTLIKIVHHYGGILGPAHPYGVRCSSAMLFKTLAKEPNIVRSSILSKLLTHANRLYPIYWQERWRSNRQAWHRRYRCTRREVSGNGSYGN